MKPKTPPEETLEAKLTSDLAAAATRKVPLRKIVVKETTIQPRIRTSERTIRDFARAMKAGAEFPPVVLAKVRGGEVVLIDGHHRVAAAKEAGLSHIGAKTLPKGWPARTFGAAAAVLNMKHGQPLKRAEKKDAWRRMMRTGWWWTTDGHASYRAMADALGNAVSHQTIARWTGEEFPRVAETLSLQAGRGRDNQHGDGDPRMGMLADPDKMALLDVKDALRAAVKSAEMITDAEMATEALETAQEALQAIRAHAEGRPGDEFG